ncbi:metal ABC transporter permease [Ectothiorhodospira haloalkaliphila]|uniref:Metal ABC transporter permease n=1 Tax=Ectothiorhodospira haloalkaliphila TaxID=421628 RepID=W8KK98_9GAMM|nr:ABC transporter ATP-binding protein/permease [Ectothiorhodospira haloalkaliphila]MCG5493039.1 ABC transporter ATP-binding protein/permease [Ectothiorhodospira variabilis]AHK79578.1 metal ABC transporter permease [Ectothiorhodospira haloalkaliphila]MCG5497240.1 ABC transporter ATP-binding protein/permease [Ectothiorhodospira variabilis]MCG5502368.1 ABC transporter ATP-binding protein/permease [Ectothiorhodospira variabilis]MCG5505866.1 ABC transporter ATP-binding protein/permease [Ectothiorh
MRYRSDYAYSDQRVNWRILLSLIPYLMEFRGRVILALVLLTLAKLANVAVPVALKYIVDHFESSPETAVMVVPVALLVAYGLLRFGSVFFSELRDAVFARVAERAMRRVSLRVFEHLHRMDLGFHLSRRTGGLARDIERGTTGISFLLRFTLFNILPTLLEIAMVAVILFVFLSPGFAVTVVVAVAIYIAFSVVVTEWRNRFVRQANQMDNRSNTRAVDSLLNFETVKYFGNEGYEARRYDTDLEAWETARMHNRLSLAALNSGQAFIIAGAITVMMVMAATQVADGSMTIGDLVMVNAYMIQLFIPLNFLGFVYREIRESLINIERVFRLMDQPAQVVDRPDARPLVPDGGEVAFDEVSFGYGADRQILHEVSFRVPAGHKLALVGSSGAGKSTIARLLFRFYDVDRGRITIHGQDVREVTQDSLRAAIGVVPQDTVLFNDTIYYNIAYGRPDATPEEVHRAARLAHLEAFIQRLPEGYDTVVGERGLKLSGGEKQRIAIARVILKDPPILVLDEATSSLDSHSEQAILGALREIARERTTLAIAHRLSTVEDADTILVLEHGRVVEQGTHDALLAANGAYAALWRRQQRGEGLG